MSSSDRNTRGGRDIRNGSEENPSAHEKGDTCENLRKQVNDSRDGKSPTHRDEYRMQIEPIGFIQTDFREKFGIPRQPGLVPGLEGVIEFCPEYRNPDFIRGLEAFEYLWLIFGFSGNWEQREDGLAYAKYSALVRPPRLGGRVKIGVFATRSPYRPNGLGLSSVKLLSADTSDAANPRLIVGGADLLDGTPIYDIKPYVTYSDAHPEAASGFATENREFLHVDFPEDLLSCVRESKRKPLMGVLAQDPRAAHDKKDGQVYGLRFANYDVRFTVTAKTLTVVQVVPAEDADKVK